VERYCCKEKKQYNFTVLAVTNTARKDRLKEFPKVNSGGMEVIHGRFRGFFCVIFSTGAAI